MVDGFLRSRCGSGSDGKPGDAASAKAHEGNSEKECRVPAVGHRLAVGLGLRRGRGVSFDTGKTGGNVIGPKRELGASAALKIPVSHRRVIARSGQKANPGEIQLRIALKIYVDALEVEAEASGSPQRIDRCKRRKAK